jgi:hypothetical protein
MDEEYSSAFSFSPFEGSQRRLLVIYRSIASIVLVFACLLIVAFVSSEEVRMERTGIYTDDQGQSFCDIRIRHRDGDLLASCKVRTAGHTHTGVLNFTPTDEGSELEAIWDCREWQWWENHSYGDEKRPRNVPATSGYEEQGSEIHVTSQYLCDGIKTKLEWIFLPQESKEVLTYDCIITITNDTQNSLIDYAQFFANYTYINKDRSHFYWSKDKTFRTFSSLGGKHLDAYIVEPGSAFERWGKIPHAVRGDGKVADTWHRPVLVGHPSPKGWRHIVFTEPSKTAGLACGMEGVAMDYIAYPGEREFSDGESFSIRVRHHIARMSKEIDVKLIEELWESFEDGLAD